MTKKTSKRPTVALTPEIVDRLSTVEMRSLVFGDNAEARAWFGKVFAGDVRIAVKELTRAWNRYRELADAIAMEKRPAEVMLFVHTALNSVFTAFHLLVSGYPVPAGNALRQFAECVAMAMLCADKSLDTFERFTADRRRFSVHKSLDLVTQDRTSRSLQKNLGLDKAAYSEFAGVMKFYDKLSHASAVTLGYSLMFTKTGGLAFGSQVDPAKRAQYKREIRQIARAARTTSHLIDILDGVLDKRPRAKTTV